jgi:predicted AAA+ superfamily ATPase
MLDIQNARMTHKVIARPHLRAQVNSALRRNPVVALLGPRQCGKTTLAKSLDSAAEYFDLEHPVGSSRLAQPMTALEPLRGLIIIDEVQRQPELFPVLRVLADREQTRAKFLVLGSASPDLVRHSSESLAGRVGFVEMSGFDLFETAPASLRRLWMRGGFPRSFLAATEAESFSWREDFVRTFLERDIGQLGIRVPAPALRRLWMMIAHYHGQVWNSSEVGRSLGESHPTIRRHLDILSGTFVVRQLQPWFANISKRQVRSPKVFIRDSGILHSLLGLSSFRALEGHPKLGASWEGFVLEQTILLAGERNSYYWATQAGAELDLLLTLRGKRYGVEVKYCDAPSLTKSMMHALTDLELHRLFVAYPGSKRFSLERRVEVLPLEELLREIGRLNGQTAS